MPTINLGVNITTQQAHQNLNELLQSTTKWSASMANKLTASVNIVFPEVAQVAQNFDKYQKKVRGQIKRMGGDAWDFQYYTRGGKESREVDFRKVFSDIATNKIDQASALNYLKQLQELQAKIQAGTAVSYGNFGASEAKQLNDLIGYLQKATEAYETLQRTKSKNVTAQTTAAARREASAMNEQERAAKKVLDVQKALAKERARHARGGGQWVSSIYKQINLYHDLEIAAKKAGDAGTMQYARNQISALNKQADAIERTNVLYGRQGKLLAGLNSIAARYFSIYTIANFAKKVAETTGYFQQQQVALEGILGSASKARDTIAEIKNFALQSPFQTKDLVTFTKQLAAFGVGNNDLFPTVKKLADISAGLGVDMGRIILAYGQVKAAAVLRGQELRQFTEAGIPMVDALSKKFTELNGKLVTTGEVFKLISERKVPFEMVASVLSDMTAEGGKFYKMQENITNTTYGQIQKLKDLWTIAMDDMGKASRPVIDTVIKGMQTAVKNIQPIITIISASVIGRGLGKLVQTGYRVIQMLRTMRFAAMAARGAIASIGGIIGLAAGAIIGFVYNAKRKNNELAKSMQEVADAYDKDTRRMVDGLDSLVKKLSTAKPGMKSFNDAVSALIANYGKFLGSDITEALTKQGIEAEKAAQKFLEMAESIKEAIRQQQLWNQLNDQAKTAGEKAGLTAAEGAGKKSSSVYLATPYADILSEIVYNGGRGVKTSALSGVAAFEKREGILHESFLEIVSTMFGQVFNEVAAEGLDYDQNSEEIRKKFAERLQNTYKLDDETVKTIAENAMSTVSETAISQFNESANKYRLANATTYAKILKPFDELDKRLSSGNYAEGYHTLDKERARYNDAFDAIRQSFEVANFEGYGTQKVSGNKTLKDLVESEERSAASAYELVQAIREFSAHKATDVVTNLSTLSDRFQQYVELRKDRAARIADAFLTEGSKVYNWRKDDDLKNIVATYGAPTNATIEKLREQLGEDKSRYESLKERSKDQREKELYQKLINAITVLQGSDLYAFGDKKTSSGGARGGGWRRLFSDLFGYIKEARAEEKKLIEHSAGNTEALAEQIYSDQLAETAVRAFWSEGSPFKRFIDKMDEYGLESEVFSKDFLKNKLGSIVTKQLEETGTIDYKNVWEQLIAVIRDRKDALKGNKDMESTVGAMENYLAQMVMEMEKFFGRIQVDELIRDQLKEMNRINANVEAIRSRRDMFEKISGSSNYLQAQMAMYGATPYRTRFNSAITRGNLMSLLGAGMGSGVSTTNAGQALSDILRSGDLGIASLSELIRIREELKSEINSMDGSSKYEDMKAALPQFDNLIKQLIEDIITEFGELMKLKDPITSGMDDIVNAFREFNDAIKKIKRGEGNGNITEGQANRMSIAAAQALYRRTIGINTPGYINLLYGASTNSGLTRNGEMMADWLGDNLLKSLYNRGQYTSLRQRQQAIESRWSDSTYRSDLTQEQRVEEKNKELAAAAEDAAKAMQMFSARIELANAIVSKVDKAIQQTVKFANDLINALEANNGIIEDEYGNATYRNDYSDARQAINMIAEFSSGVSGVFQSLLSGDIFGAFMGIGSTIAKFFENLFGIGDSQLQKRQDKILSSNKLLERAMKNLEHTLNDVAGADKWDNLTEQIKKLREMEQNNRELQNIEGQKKHGDTEKYDSYRDAAEENARQIDDIIRGIREDILGTADDLAQSLTDAFVEAFRNGENAARAWRDTVRSYISDMLKDKLLERVLAPRIDKILDSFGIKEGSTDTDSILAMLSDPDKMVDLRNQIFGEGTWFVNWFNSLPKTLQEMIGWNSSTSELSGGIQGITEDTARTLEGLANTMLSQMIIANRGVQDISGITQSQLGELRSIQVQAEAIAENTLVMRRILTGDQIQTRPLRVTID